ncbi:hypothetical protein STAQ_28850 [Allostella sp. ATCC 35155]|nr:hypothetical protein STAQ_28850 [Stella sp. ATCC 35155]
MRITRLEVTNFKGFEQRAFRFHPEFNLLVGVNGTGKTSILDALAIALGGWLSGMPGQAARAIGSHEVRLAAIAASSENPGSTAASWEGQYPCTVAVEGQVDRQPVEWSRSIRSPGGRTTNAESRLIRLMAGQAAESVRGGRPVVLPLVSYYGTGRLWNVPRDQARVTGADDIGGKADTSRLTGYRNSLDPRLSVAELVRWFGRQAWITFQQNGREPVALDGVRTAILGCLEGVSDIGFDAGLGEVVVRLHDGTQQPFTNLSDGQRTMLAMVGDIAFKAVTLNPQFGTDAVTKTPGVVLVDELDLHLHPRWQRRLIEALRTTFCAMQFICTTHSPFLIQSLRSGEELLMLDGQPTAQLADKSLDEIAHGIMGVARPEVSARYDEMRQVARRYLTTVDEAARAPAAQLATYKERLADEIAPFADNPAFQAFLEMNRVAKLGE